jgi:hypothetical protein
MQIISAQLLTIEIAKFIGKYLNLLSKNTQEGRSQKSKIKSQKSTGLCDLQKFKRKDRQERKGGNAKGKSQNPQITKYHKSYISYIHIMPQHIYMLYPVLQIYFTNSFKSKGLIKMLQVKLGADFNGTLPE